MGQEALCRVRYDGEIADGKAMLEPTELMFRGDLRLRIPLNDISTLEQEGDELRVSFPGGIAIFELGKATATKWANRIRSPRTLLEKLGVKPGDAIAVIGVYEEQFVKELQAKGIRYAEDELIPNADLIFYGADQVHELEALPGLRDSIKRNGAIWVVSLKGPGAFMRDVDVIAAARRAGLVDNKVVSFSETHTALRLVIPRDQR